MKVYGVLVERFVPYENDYDTELCGVYTVNERAHEVGQSIVNKRTADTQAWDSTKFCYQVYEVELDGEVNT